MRNQELIMMWQLPVSIQISPPPTPVGPTLLDMSLTTHTPWPPTRTFDSGENSNLSGTFMMADMHVKPLETALPSVDILVAYESL